MLLLGPIREDTKRAPDQTLQETHQ